MIQGASITLASGRTIALVALDQSVTYEGLLEGIPTVEMNARRVAWLVKGGHAGSSLAPYLVPPKERLIEHQGYPFGTPAALPRVTCVARFQSRDVARDARCDYSELRIIWFQESFALPIDPEVLEHIRDIRWEEHAHDLEI